MISKLRDEEQSDIDHKDWCESERNKANTLNEDLEYAKGSYAGECWKQGGMSLFAWDPIQRDSTSSLTVEEATSDLSGPTLALFASASRAGSTRA